jgi:hypothetical protein
MRAIAGVRRRFGYRRLHVLLKREDYLVNHKKLFLLYREEPRPQLGWKTPSEFARNCNPRRDLTLRYAEGSAPTPVAATAQPGKANCQGEIKLGGPMPPLTPRRRKRD